MSDTVILVAIIVPAVVLNTLGVVAIVFGHRFNMKVYATKRGANLSAESKPEYRANERSKKPSRRGTNSTSQ